MNIQQKRNGFRAQLEQLFKKLSENKNNENFSTKDMQDDLLGIDKSLMVLGDIVPEEFVVNF